MIGDNLDADVKGAEQAGIRAILVRKHSAEHARCCAQLSEILKWIEPEVRNLFVRSEEARRYHQFRPRYHDIPFAEVARHLGKKSDRALETR